MTISFVLISFCNRYQPKYHRNLRNLDDVYQKVPSSWSMFLLSIEVFEKHAVAFVGYAKAVRVFLLETYLKEHVTGS